MTDDQPPIVDEFDNLSAFMALPEVLQNAALMVVYAGRDIPLEQRALAHETLATMAQWEDRHPEETRHFMAMCEHMLTALQLARGPWAGSVDPEGRAD